MQYYDYDKDTMYDEMKRFIEEHSESELLQILADVIKI
jgi:hypothetical protein